MFTLSTLKHFTIFCNINQSVFVASVANSRQSLALCLPTRIPMIHLLHIRVELPTLERLEHNADITVQQQSLNYHYEAKSL